MTTQEIITMITSVLFGGGWLLQVIKGQQEKKRRTAEAETIELANEQSEVQRLEERIERRDEKLDHVYAMLREEQNAHLATTRELGEEKVKSQMSENKRCDLPGCAKRLPPSDF